MAKAARRRFELTLIKPSHYDDDGYVIQWRWSLIPSNTLSVLHGLASDAAERFALGPDVEIKITAIDETNAPVRPAAIAGRLRKAGGFGLVGLIGVQSNQFPRALHIAEKLRAAGVPVVIGGFHVSGSLAMLPDLTPELRRALDIGVSLFAGEAEGRFDELLRDAAAGRLKPIYNHLSALPAIAGAPVPFQDETLLRRNYFAMTSFDAGRGCPFQCSFCTIINVQGRQSRRRSPEDIEAIIRRNVAQGVYRFFITDDNFARNRDWEPILDRIIHMRESEGFEPIRLTIQVDSQAHKIPRFIDKARRANVFNMFVGLENIHADTLIGAKKRQNRISEYRELFLACKKARIVTTAGYILGFPRDTPASIVADIEIIKRELPVDLLEFFFLTPLPGSEDHQKLAASGAAMDADLNKYDLNHAVAAHAVMSKAEWEEAHRKAWETYYTPEHIETVMRRGAAFGIDYKRFDGLAYFRHFAVREKIHPLEAGLIRRKSRRDRRPERKRENPLSFHPKFAFETAANLFALWRAESRRRALGRRIAQDPQRFVYSDRALAPLMDSDDDTLELLNHSEAARDAVRRLRQIQRLTKRDAGQDQMDDYWKGLADFLTRKPGGFGASLAPKGVVERIPGLTAFGDWDRGQILNRLVIHKGLADEVPKGLLESVFGAARAVFANEVFVVYDIAVTADDHERAAQQALMNAAMRETV